jgi:SAM-dependent methyltransferase
MRNAERWVPSKFVYRNGTLRASSDPAQVWIGSRLAAELVADRYGTHLREHARGRLADLGCGKVPLYQAYRDYVAEVVCVDWKHSAHGNAHVDFLCDLCEPLPLADRQFDTIVLSDVLEHVAQPERLWMEVSRILARDGKVLANAPFYYWLHEQPHDYYRYTEFALRRFVEASGLVVLTLQPLGGAPEVLADILAKNLLRLPRLGRLPAILLQQATAAFVKTTLGRRVSTLTAREFPIGYFLVAQKPS